MKTIIHQMRRGGYTLIELLITIAMIFVVLGSIALVGGVVYILVHFASKYW